MSTTNEERLAAIEEEVKAIRQQLSIRTVVVSEIDRREQDAIKRVALETCENLKQLIAEFELSASMGVMTNIRHISASLNKLLKNLYINDDVAEILHALDDKGKIHAIKTYREKTGAGLAEAKRAVERIESEHKSGIMPRFR